MTDTDVAASGKCDSKTAVGDPRAASAVAMSEVDALLALGQAQQEIATLKQALESRTVIGQATGMLMVQFGLSAEHAFAHLIKRSSHTNVKVRVIATSMVEEATELARRSAPRSPAQATPRNRPRERPPRLTSWSSQ